MTILRKFTLISAKIGDWPIPIVIEGQLEVPRNWVYIEDDRISAMEFCEREESIKPSSEEKKTECEDGARQTTRQNRDEFWERQETNERKEVRKREKRRDTKWEAGESERKSREKYRERKDGRARGRSSGSSEARVAGEGRGFESGVAFRGARSALSSREPGERERTCVPARRKRVVFSHPRQTILVVLAALTPAKRGNRDKIATNAGCVDIFHFFFPLPSLRFSRWTLDETFGNETTAD